MKEAEMNSDQTATSKSYARLLPTEELRALKDRFRVGPNVSAMEPPPPALEVTACLAEVLRLGLNALVRQRDEATEEAGRQGARAVRAELCTRIYLRFVENLSDDTIEDMSLEDIGAAARDLLAEMY